MVIISKHLFYKNLPTPIRCDKLIHPQEASCLKFNIYMAQNLCVGVSKFLVPCYLAKLFLNRKKINKQYLKQWLISFIRSEIYGFLLGILTISPYCVLSKIFGEIGYYTACFMPGFIAGFSLLVEDKDNRIFDTVAFVNWVLEAAINNIRYFNTFNFNKSREVILFMLSSSFLMYLLQNRTKKIDFMHLWFYVPPRSKNPSDNKENQKCYHIEKCSKYCFDGSIKYLSAGYAINLFKMILPRMGAIAANPKLIIPTVFDKSNFKFGVFLSAYVSLYRYISCLLIKQDGMQKSWHAALAGLLSGATYLISPNIQILIISLTTILQIFYQKIKRKYMHILDNRIPLHILFAICNGILYFNRIACIYSCPKIYKNMLGLGTNYKLEMIYNHITTTFF